MVLFPIKLVFSDRLRRFDETNANVSMFDAMLAKSTERLNGHCDECCSRTCCPLRAYQSHSHTLTQALDPSAHVCIAANDHGYVVLLCASFTLNVSVVSSSGAHRETNVHMRGWACAQRSNFWCGKKHRHGHNRNVIWPLRREQHTNTRVCTDGHTSSGKCTYLFYFFFIYCVCCHGTRREAETETNSNTRFIGNSDAGGFLFGFFTFSVDAWNVLFLWHQVNDASFLRRRHDAQSDRCNKNANRSNFSYVLARVRAFRTVLAWRTYDDHYYFEMIFRRSERSFDIHIFSHVGFELIAEMKSNSTHWL